MRDLLLVVANEWSKLIRKKRLWITIILGVLVIVGLSVISKMEYNSQLRYTGIEGQKNQIEMTQQRIHELENGTADTPNDPNYSKEDEIKSLKDELKAEKDSLDAMTKMESGDWRQGVKDNIKNIKAEMKSSPDNGYGDIQIRQLEYHLSHNIKPIPEWETTSYKSVQSLITLISLIFLPMLVVILVSDIVSGETTSGTIKLLLVRPISRVKILFGKWIVSMLATLVLSLSFLAAMWVLNIGLFGTKGALEPVLVNIKYTFEKQFEHGTTFVNAIPHLAHAYFVPSYLFILVGILLTAFAMLAVASLSFLFSTLFKSAMVSTGVAFAFVIIGQIFVQMIHNGHYVLWLFSVHLDLLAHWTGDMSRSFEMNVPLSLGTGVILAWIIVPLILALMYFRKKDIFNA